VVAGLILIPIGTLLRNELGQAVYTPVPDGMIWSRCENQEGNGRL